MRRYLPAWLLPRQLLLMDAAGAALTSLLTAFVLAPGLLPTGLPRSFLLLLAGIASAYCIAGSIAFIVAHDLRRILGLLAFANIAYCAVTLIACLTFTSTLTWLGAAWFAGEIAIILLLAATEISFSRN